MRLGWENLRLRLRKAGFALVVFSVVLYTIALVLLLTMMDPVSKLSDYVHSVYRYSGCIGLLALIISAFGQRAVKSTPIRSKKARGLVITERFYIGALWFTVASITCGILLNLYWYFVALKSLNTNPSEYITFSRIAVSIVTTIMPLSAVLFLLAWLARYVVSRIADGRKSLP
jgi:hypothetical protein